MPKGKARTPRAEENHEPGLNQEAFSALGQEQHDNVRPTRFQNCYGPVLISTLFSSFLMTVSIKVILIHLTIVYLVFPSTPQINMLKT